MIKNQVDHDRLFKELLETFFAEASAGPGAHGVAGRIFRAEIKILRRFHPMVVRKEDIHNLVERLREHDQKTVFDFLQYLIERSEGMR